MRILLIAIFFSLSQLCQSQSIQQLADSIFITFQALQQERYDEEKREHNHKLIMYFDQFLEKEGSFKMRFDTTKVFSDQFADDNRLRVITWLLPLRDGTFEYYGYIQYYDKKQKSYSVYQLKDQSESIVNPEFQQLKPGNWLGALYYNIITEKYKGKRYYTLLGWDGNNTLTTKKLVDVLIFENGKPVFGAPIFHTETKTRHRIIFEHGSQVVMGLNYDKKYKGITFDHLSPSQPNLKGQYQFYGPDFSVDGLKFKKGEWLYEKDIDARNRN